MLVRFPLYFSPFAQFRDAHIFQFLRGRNVRDYYSELNSGGRLLYVSTYFFLLYWESPAGDWATFQIPHPKMRWSGAAHVDECDCQEQDCGRNCHFYPL